MVASMVRQYHPLKLTVAPSLGVSSSEGCAKSLRSKRNETFTDVRPEGLKPPTDRDPDDCRPSMYPSLTAISVYPGYPPLT